MQQFITDRLPEIEELCRKHHVRRMSIFGSAVREDFDAATSDVDFHVEFADGVVPAQSWGQLRMKEELRALLSREVDLIHRPIRNSYLRREVEITEVTIYAA